MNIMIVSVLSGFAVLPTGVKTGQLLGLQSTGSCKCASGIFDINIDTGISTLVDYFLQDPSEGALAVAPDGTIYAAFSGGGDSLFSIDIATGELTEIGPFGFVDVSGLTFGPDGTLYGYDDIGGQLIKIDVATGAGTAIGPVALDGNGGLAFSPEGVLYGAAYGGLVWTIDPKTGESTLVGDMGEGIFGDEIAGASGLEFVGHTLYASASTEPQYRALYIVNTATGEATTVGLFDPKFNESSMNGLAFLPGPGDADRDGDADLDDFARFQACFTGPEGDEPGEPDDPPLPVECQFLDTDKDRDIDLHDFASFQSGFTGPNEE